jgi:hypothetical protein
VPAMVLIMAALCGAGVVTSRHIRRTGSVDFVKAGRASMTVWTRRIARKQGKLGARPGGVMGRLSPARRPLSLDAFHHRFGPGCGGMIGSGETAVTQPAARKDRRAPNRPARSRPPHSLPRPRHPRAGSLPPRRPRRPPRSPAPQAGATPTFPPPGTAATTSRVTRYLWTSTQ